MNDVLNLQLIQLTKSWLYECISVCSQLSYFSTSILHCFMTFRRKCCCFSHYTHSGYKAITNYAFLLFVKVKTKSCFPPLKDCELNLNRISRSIVHFLQIASSLLENELYFSNTGVAIYYVRSPFIVILTPLQER